MMSLVRRLSLAHTSSKTHKPMGTDVNHFFAGVYCAPESICSHSVRSSKAPLVVILRGLARSHKEVVYTYDCSKGTPVTW